MSKQTDNIRPPKTGIFVQYYEGAYGPTILIDTMKWDELQKIRSLFVRLARGEIDITNLLTAEQITPIGFDVLVLTRLKCNDEREKCIEFKRGKTGTIEFQWSLPAVEWWGCVNLVDGFTEGKSGHHYFGSEENDDAIIVLQYMESAAYRGLK